DLGACLRQADAVAADEEAVVAGPSSPTRQFIHQVECLRTDTDCQHCPPTARPAHRKKIRPESPRVPATIPHLPSRPVPPARLTPLAGPSHPRSPRRDVMRTRAAWRLEAL